jgi:class 3 adenylate cyclase
MKPTSGSRTVKALQSSAPLNLAELMAIWRSHDSKEWSRFPQGYRALVERILAHGEPLLAYDVVREGLGVWPADIRLRQLQGLALARSGAMERANAVLEKLRSESEADEETLGMLGRTYKDLAAAATIPAQRTHYLKRAAKAYSKAYRTSGGYWSGINEATTSLLIGKKERAYELASKVREQCLKEVADPSGDSYWELVTLGEAALICRDWPEAENWYARAAAEGKDRFGELNSSRRNARLILRHWNEDESWIDNFLRVPCVAVFAGHMIDRPTRSEARFPENLESAVANKIQQQIDSLKPGFGFSSAACGSDILFLEAMLARGAEVSVVLPYNREEFARDSVEIGSTSKNWRARFDRVLGRAARVITASNQRLAIGGVSYEYCNQLVLGLATIRAHQLDTELKPLAVWNGLPGDGPGGAASVIEMWRKFGYEPEVIDLAKILDGRASSGTKSRATTAAQSEDSSRFAARVVAVLFADTIGFSKLSEAQVPRFVEHFLGAIAQLAEKFSESIIAKNTWGDGLYFVFSDVDVAGNFALALADLVATTKWEEKGLPADLNLRIALHAGPVYEFNDPVTGSRSYTGTHVSRAARIEPITPRGQVYASEAFAALAAARLTAGFTCDYVGQTLMAKGYGTLPMYHVRRS